MITLDFTAVEEAQIVAVAKQTGVAPNEYVKNLVKEHLPQAKNQFVDDPEKRAAAIALLRRWIDEAPTDPEEIREAQAERQEFLQNLNKNRIEAGEKPLFP